MARSSGGFRDRMSIFGELWSFMKVRKKWWLGPIVHHDANAVCV